MLVLDSKPGAWSLGHSNKNRASPGTALSALGYLLITLYYLQVSNLEYGWSAGIVEHWHGRLRQQAMWGMRVSTHVVCGECRV
ncbi:hypothetical protein CEXT_688581 [Caerostris extrusa]|uniref:Uncharacterized protein n=1 Tax=Caerostris extrusa TaxID=172846 RepID=A0AAV4SPQ1_CAEEX|nr:hypothetical protein CEXT_688581 [Caerostris extrusa]